MKILQINKFHYLKGGAERSYLETAKILKAHGHEVAFFSMQAKENLLTKFNKYFVSNINYHQKFSISQKVRQSIKAIYNREAYRNLDKLIQDFQPDVAHLHNINRQLTPSVIYALKKNNIPMVMTLHDYQLISPAYNLFSQGKLYERCIGGKYYRCFLDKCLHNSYSKSFVAMLEAYVYKFLNPYRYIKVFIAPSLFLKQKFQQAGFKNKIIKLANPLNIKSSAEAKDNNYFLYFGRLSAEKGIDTIIQAVAEAKNLNSKIIIAGEGPLSQKLKVQSQKLGVEDRIKFIGYQEKKELIKIITNARAVVIPSLCYENAPYALREAQLLTKIVICAKVGGLQEYVKSNETGFIFKAGNEQELAKILEKIDSNKNLRKKIVQNLKNSLKNNSENDYYKSLINIYYSLSNER
ncbi:MAG: glycosyltransferase [Candidatus Falkowbacteria bacterium]